MSAPAVTVLLLGVTLVCALSAHLLLSAIGLFAIDVDGLEGAAIVTVIVGTPIILYAQSVIRELLASRRALRLMTDRLAWALNNAEQANEAKSAFLATMSHELRTPLNAIIGFSDIVANERLGALDNARYRGYAADINASGRHLLEIINDILDIAKIETGAAGIEDEAEMSVAMVVQAASTMVGPLADRSGVTMRCSTPADDVTLIAVERMVRQVLVNILSNAVKFTPAGGSVHLDVASRADGATVLRVSDTGIGMSAEDIKIALQPFGRVESPLGRAHGGTGLGLPLAKSMMELHDGRLLIDSTPGEGTVVELVFPPARVKAVEPDAVSAR